MNNQQLPCFFLDKNALDTFFVLIALPSFPSIWSSKVAREGISESPLSALAINELLSTKNAARNVKTFLKALFKIFQDGYQLLGEWSPCAN